MSSRGTKHLRPPAGTGDVPSRDQNLTRWGQMLASDSAANAEARGEAVQDKDPW